MRGLRAVLRRSIPMLVLGVVFCISSCDDHCTDVECGPAPPPLEVIVRDSLSVDTTLYIVRSNPTRTDTVDTVLVVASRPTLDAVVTLLRVDGKDTIAFDTLTVQDDGFVELDATTFPSTRFLARAQRGERKTTIGSLLLQQVEGCCSYPIVGRYSILLPQKP